MYSNQRTKGFRSKQDDGINTVLLAISQKRAETVTVKKTVYIINLYISMTTFRLS